MTRSPNRDLANGRKTRVDWVDTAKGICILLVVLMHTTLGVEEALGVNGWLGAFVAFAKPFRMPDFFLVSALFLSARIEADWRLYLDRKVLHFAYFYLLWTAVQLATKSFFVFDGDLPAIALAYVEALVQPFGTLWFIYLLAIFFVVTKLLRRAPVALVWAGAALLEMAPVETGWILIDEFASRFVYFYTGHIFARHVFALAGRAAAFPLLAIGALGAWALTNGYLVDAGLSQLPGVSLVLGLAGAIAITVISSLIARTFIGRGFAYAGARSLAIYLAFFLPMAVMRIVLVRTGVIDNVDAISALITATAYLSPLVALALVRGTALRFFFERPAWARLAPAAGPGRTPPGALTPAG